MRIRLATLGAVLWAAIAAAAPCPEDCLDIEAVPVGRGIEAPQACQCDGDEPTTRNWRHVGGNGGPGACFEDTQCTLADGGSFNCAEGDSCRPWKDVVDQPDICTRGESFQKISNGQLYVCTSTDNAQPLSSMSGESGAQGFLETLLQADGQALGPDDTADDCNGAGDPWSCCLAQDDGPTCPPKVRQTDRVVEAPGFESYQHATDGGQISLQEGADDGTDKCTIKVPDSGLNSDGSTRVLFQGCRPQEFGQVCVTLDGAASTDDDFEYWIASEATTGIAVTCHCSANCGGTLPTLAFEDRAGNAIALTGGGDLACTSGSSASTYTTFSTGDSDRLLVAGEGLAFDVTNTPSGSPRVTICTTVSVP